MIPRSVKKNSEEREGREIRPFFQTNELEVRAGIGERKRTGVSLPKCVTLDKWLSRLAFVPDLSNGDATTTFLGLL